MDISKGLAFLILSLASFGSAHGWEEREVYSRVEILEGTAGEIEIYESFDVLLDLPQTECGDSGPFSCASTVQYSKVYGLRFYRESVRRESVEPITERVPVGFLTFTTTMDEQQERDFLSKLELRLKLLSSAAFKSPFAGIQSNEAPLDPYVLAPGEHASWLCFRSGDRVRAIVHTPQVAEEGSTKVVGMANHARSGSEDVDQVCSSIEKSLPVRADRSIRTIISPSRLLFDSVHLAIDDRTSDDEADHAYLPAEFGYAEEAVSLDGHNAGSASYRDGSYMVQRTQNGMNQSLRYAKHDLDVSILGKPLIVGEWSRRPEIRGFGSLDEANAESPPVPESSARFAYIPVRSSQIQREVDRIFDLDSMLEHVAESLEGQLAPTDEVAVEAMQLEEDWLGTGVYLYVSCRGSKAMLGLYPFNSAIPATNPRQVCRALDALF